MVCRKESNTKFPCEVRHEAKVEGEIGKKRGRKRERERERMPEVCHTVLIISDHFNLHWWRREL